ncbi:MAG: TetR/AcrR family transcriptional regulator [Pseudomonadota bacterium]
MARPTREEIEHNIRKAVVQTVVEQGIGSVSVGEIAKRAKVSPGTIYLHHANKEDMLQSVYLQIKTEFHEIMIASRDEVSSEAMLRRMWFDMFEFVSTYPLDFLFIEDAGAASVLTDKQKGDIAYMAGDIRGMVQRAIDDETLADMAADMAVTLMVGPALLLAKRMSASREEQDQALINQTFDRVWLSVKK